MIEESWAREEPIPPYQIYLKIAYHLSQEARAGLSEFQIPREFRNKLFDFQTAAVKIAAHHVNKRGGVLIGDVVGLGKTLMATALARILEDDLGLETLIICPKNLVPMWEDYREQYRLRARVLSHSVVERELPDLRRYRVVIIDESHNLRNREGKRYRAIQEYIHANDSKCILLSATPYNKTYLDLAQPAPPVHPRRRRHRHPAGASAPTISARPSSSAATRRRPLARGLREQRLRRRLARPDAAVPGAAHAQLHPGQLRRDRPDQRPQVPYASRTARAHISRFGRRSRCHSSIDDKNPADQYARLYARDVVQAITGLHLPRYGLGNYVAPTPARPADNERGQDARRSGSRR